MIGIYDYTVILTYMGLMSALSGMFCSFTGHNHLAVLCLALCGLFDTFDGKIARTKKNRTAREKRFGIQIDSLCDMVSFGVFPVVICFHTGMNRPAGLFILAFFCLAGLIRLAFFNVLEEERQQETEEKMKYYHGLPITSVSVILPMIYISSALLGRYYLPILYVAMLITGFLFILDFRFPKPGNKQLILLILVVAAAVLFILLNYKWRGYFKWNYESLSEPLEQLTSELGVL